jgi:uncharacterized membrane protein YccF (DUF307 family)
VGSLAVGVGWLSACAAAIVAIKIVLSVPGSFTRAEWTAFALWTFLGAVVSLGRPSPSAGEREGSPLA